MQQSGFTPGHSIADRILTLNLISQTRREYRQPLYAEYIDLKAAFDSVDRRALSKLFQVLELPPSLFDYFKPSIKTPRAASNMMVLSLNAFDLAMDRVLN